MCTTQEDFRLYYAEPCRDFAFMEDYEIYTLFPEEASNTEIGKKKALDALVRFVKAGIAEFNPPEKTEEIFEELKDAPLNLPPYPIEWMAIWSITQMGGTMEFIKRKSKEMGFSEDSEDPIPSDLEEKLSKIFSDAGVGFDQDVSY